MEKKITKIWGIGLTFVMVVSLMLVAAPTPVSAADPVINEWDEFAYPSEGEEGDWFWDPDIMRVGEITEAINGDLYVHVFIMERSDHIFKSTDGGHTWEDTDYTDDVEGEWVFDMVCSSIDEDILYVTDGFYVFKTDDGGDTFDFVAKDSLEVALGGDCGCDLDDCVINYPIITSIDVGYQDEDDPFVFIGTRAHDVLTGDGCSPCVDTGDSPMYPGSVYYLAEEDYGAAWTDIDLSCEYDGYDALAVGCAPDFDDTDETYVVISNGSETHVVYTDGGICEWHEFSELLWNCETANHFGSLFASRIGFPDDWEDTGTLFVGVVDDDPCYTCDDIDGCGGDVYSVTDGGSIDRNVYPGTGGCSGEATDIISLDVCGDTDEASLIAGAFCDNTVYYSTDGGWEWDASVKSPTGEGLTYAIWYGDCGESALAVTAGCECAVSLSCVSEEDDADEVGKSWNQISLIATDITCVLDIDHSPGYITNSETLFMVTECESCCSEGTTSLFRNEGTDWERVFCSETYADEFVCDSLPYDNQLKMVQVSPDFLDTGTVFVANPTFDIFRSQDAGCSWDRLGYPCNVITISSWAVLDEDTIYVGSEDGDVYLTERHGSRPWDVCLVEDADDGTDAGDIMYLAFDITEGTMTILVGDDECKVFLCEVDPDEDWEDQEWHLVGTGTDGCQDVLDCDNKNTCVAFDPSYANNDKIYAAAGEKIALCEVDPDEEWKDQEWDKKCSSSGSEFWGMVAVGDTTLYVGDKAAVDTDDGGLLRRSDTCEQVTEGLATGTRLSGLSLTAGANGCPDSNVLWAIEETPDCSKVWFYEDTLATPVILTSPADEAQLEKTSEVTLTWEALCDAEEYQIYLYRYCAECPDEKLYILKNESFECEEECVGCSDETCCLVVDGLEPGVTYYWKVRVYKGEPTRSKWSEKREFNTEMTAIPFIDLCSPACGGDDIIITPNFSWDAVSGATSYEVQLATNEDFDPVLASGTPTTNAWLGAPELDYGTTYYWRVRVVKDGITSSWVTCIFTTMDEPAAKVYTCPQCGMEFATEAELQAHWDAKHAPAAPSTPMYIWLIIGIGALLVIAVLVLIVRTRRTV
jgi:hypothetical protein